MRKRLPLLACAVLLPLAAAAQTIPIKTVPVAEGDQFLVFPSQNLGMGGVAIALDDPLLDPFVNPAKAASTEGIRFASAPVYYGFTEGEAGIDAGSGRTLPVGVVLRQGNVFGGAAIAWQELVVPEQPGWGGWRGGFADVSSDVRVEEGGISRDNVYLFGMTGMKIPGTNLSVGVSAFGAGLNGLEGVRLLYQTSPDVRQRGEMGLFRLGLYNAWPDGRAAELLVAHHRFSATHTMARWTWDEEGMGRFEEQIERDETQGWAVQAGYKQPVGNGWTAGAQLTGDWKWHPKIPNYDLMQIPRDPGHSWAYNVGVGFARTSGPATFALDLIYEPIWSHTWADALEATPTATGGTVPAGAMTVENDFRFHNARVRLGLQRAVDRFDFRLGLDAHRIRYRLDQEHYVEEFARAQRERWTEWTASGGLGVRFPEFELRYLGLVTLGTGQPGVASSWGWGAERADFAALSADFLVAPSGTLSLAETTVITHQVSVILPITN